SGSEHPVTVEADGAGALLRSGPVTSRVHAPNAEVAVTDDVITLHWDAEVPADGEVVLDWRAVVDDPTAVVGGAEPSAAWSAF
ncbi:hypothetical protein SB767_34080, partial [Bacillus sp. SIMBA_069]